MQRQIVLDTETTGLDVEQGHRIIEIGCVELKNRRPTGNNFHRYVNPGREIDAGAVQVHGITSAFLADKPNFAGIAQELWTYLDGAELIIHNAPFDVGFLNREFTLCGQVRRLDEVCTITDTVKMARRLHPGQKVNLDALCKRYSVDNSNRDFHGALLDARLLADVYLSMTGGQSKLTLDAEQAGSAQSQRSSRFAEFSSSVKGALLVPPAGADERVAHEAWRSKMIDKGKCLWTDP